MAEIQRALRRQASTAGPSGQGRPRAESVPSRIRAGKYRRCAQRAPLDSPSRCRQGVCVGSASTAPVRAARPRSSAATVAQRVRPSAHATARARREAPGFMEERQRWRRPAVIGRPAFRDEPPPAAIQPLDEFLRNRTGRRRHRQDITKGFAVPIAAKSAPQPMVREGFPTWSASACFTAHKKSIWWRNARGARSWFDAAREIDIWVPPPT